LTTNYMASYPSPHYLEDLDHPVKEYRAMVEIEDSDFYLAHQQRGHHARERILEAVSNRFVRQHGARPPRMVWRDLTLRKFF